MKANNGDKELQCFEAYLRINPKNIYEAYVPSPVRIQLNNINKLLIILYYIIIFLLYYHNL